MSARRQVACRWTAIKRRTALCLTITFIVAVYFVSVKYIQPASSCYGPCVTATVDKDQIVINETVTVTGQLCPPLENNTARVLFLRPDYTSIDRYVTTDQAGNFTVTQQLDMAGYWSIFAINGVIFDRTSTQVSDPSQPNAPFSSPKISMAYKPNYPVIAATAVALSMGATAFLVGKKNKTIKISSLRLLIQIGLVLLIFFGIFVDHQNLPVPAAKFSPHELALETNVFGTTMPDGFPVPFFGCYYPCGRTVTCALWEIQAYIYPFFNTGAGWGVTYDSAGIFRLAVVLGVVILAAIILGRLFCGWVCPFGLYLDIMTRLRKALRIKRRVFSDKLNKQLHQLSYVILAVVIIICVIFGSEAIFGTQLVSGSQKGGFIWTYYSAPFCQVCPMKPFCLLADASIGLMQPSWTTQTTTGQFLQLGFYLTSINLIILGLVTVAAFYFRRSWCRICPLGALVAVFNRFPPFKWISGVRLNKTEEKCKKCGICKRVCPTQVTEVYDQKSGDVASSQCIWCLRCVEMCPYEDCLQFKFAGKTICKSRNWLEKPNNSKDELND